MTPKLSASATNNCEIGEDNASAVNSSSAFPEGAVKTSEAELIKQLTNVMLTSSREVSNLSSSKPTKKTKEDYKFWKTQPVPDLGTLLTSMILLY